MDAGLVCYIDSDCIFREPVKPDDYMVDDKPVMLVESYAALKRKNDGAVCWQKGTADVLGFNPTHECMRRHPAVHWTITLQCFREHIEDVHNKDFDSYAMSRKHDFPVGFNDFNNLGAFAHRFMPSSYHIVDLTDHPERRPRDKIIQYWSHSPIDKPQDNWLDNKKRTVVPIEEIKKIL
jgi:hypothetical protein